MYNLNNIYRKGKYKVEREKHIGTYLVKLGNRKFRKDTLLTEEREYGACLTRKRKKGRKAIIVKVTTINNCGRKYSKVKRFWRMKDAEQSIKRNSVIRYFFK